MVCLLAGTSIRKSLVLFGGWQQAACHLKCYKNTNSDLTAATRMTTMFVNIHQPLAKSRSNKVASFKDSQQRQHSRVFAIDTTCFIFMASQEPQAKASHKDVLH
jgi:hypothetical protein